MNSVLLVRGGALGDFIVTLPSIQALRGRFSRVAVLVNGAFTELIPGGVEVSGALNDSKLAPLFNRHQSLSQRLPQQFAAYSTVISYLHDPEKIFEDNVRRAGALKFVVGPHTITGGLHATEQLAAPLRELGIADIDLVARIAITRDEQTVAWSQLGMDRPVQTSDAVAIHPGSGSGRKNWPVEHWIQLVQYILGRRLRIVVVGGEAYLEQIAGIRKQFGNRLSYAVGWPLRRLAALLASTIFVGHDSGVSHLAAATGAQSLILFGPTDPRVWAPRNPNVTILTAPDRKLERLSVAEVCAALPR